MAERGKFKRGDIVYVSVDDTGECSDWNGIARVHSIVGLSRACIKWIIQPEPEHYYKHSNGCDAYVPASWLTKLRGVGGGDV